jgi:hypothetical protein
MSRNPAMVSSVHLHAHASRGRGTMLHAGAPV